MPAEIIPFPGCEFPDQGVNEQPQPKIIALLEQWLELAENGELQAVALGGVRGDAVVLTDWDPGTGPNRHHLVAAAADLQHRMIQEIKDDIDADETPPPISA